MHELMFQAGVKGTVTDLGWFPGFHGTPLSCTGLLLYKLYSKKLTQSPDYTQD